jgi:hypothetical protein
MRDEGTVPNKFDEFKDEIEEPFPVMVWATTEFKFEIPKTFRVLAPYMVAELAKRDWTFRVVTFAVVRDVMAPTLMTCEFIYGIVNVS